MTTLKQKIALLDQYIKRPLGIGDPAILRVIKADVVRANTKNIKKAAETNTTLYNQCMGIYRQFLKSRDSHLNLQGRKAAQYKEAMNNLISWIRTMQRNNGKPYDDPSVLRGLTFIFKNWERLNDYHKNRLSLPDIYKSIEEIIPIIKNGNKTATRGKTATLGKDFGKL